MTQRVQMTAFQSMQQGWDNHAPVQRGSWDLDSPMAAAISASMAGEPPAASSVLCGDQYLLARNRTGSKRQRR